MRLLGIEAEFTAYGDRRERALCFFAGALCFRLTDGVRDVCLCKGTIFLAGQQFCTVDILSVGTDLCEVGDQLTACGGKADGGIEEVLFRRFIAVDFVDRTDRLLGGFTTRCATNGFGTLFDMLLFDTPIRASWESIAVEKLHGVATAIHHGAGEEFTPFEVINSLLDLCTTTE